MNRIFGGFGTILGRFGVKLMGLAVDYGRGWLGFLVILTRFGADLGEF